MAVIIKPKRSEIGSAVPTTSNLVVGEMAVNTADKIIYVRDSSNIIVPIANFADIPVNLEEQIDALEAAVAAIVFPTGDYGDLTTSSTDAFGQSIDRTFDCLTAPVGALATTDLGALT
jgi:hypothetical protein